MSVLALKGSFIEMIGRFLQALLDGRWYNAWAAVAPFFVVVLAILALRYLLLYQPHGPKPDAGVDDAEKLPLRDRYPAV